MNPTPDHAQASPEALTSDLTLEEINRLWTIVRTFSNTAHAVNNALQVIGGSAELLEAGEGLDPTVLRRIQTIRGQTAKAASAVGALLEYSRGAGEVRAWDFEALVKIAVDMRLLSLSRAQIGVDVEPADGGPLRVVGKHAQLLQLLLNLLMLVEEPLLGRDEARLVARLSRTVDHVQLLVTGTGGTRASTDGRPAASASESAAAMTRVQRSVSEQLTAAARGSLTVEETPAGLPLITLNLPAAPSTGQPS